MVGHKVCTSRSLDHFQSTCSYAENLQCMCRADNRQLGGGSGA